MVAPASLSIEALSKAFNRFADHECPQEPVYDALCRAAAADPEMLRLLWAAPLEQQRPNLLLAAVHDLILRGTPHALREYFPSAGGARPVDAEFVACFRSFADEQRTALCERIAHRTTQTNEIGRCAVLWPALQYIARVHGAGRPLALIDFGCSAGLNLGVDAYRYDYGAFALGAAAGAQTPEIHCRLVGPHAPPVSPATEVRLTQRLGLDIAPTDVRDQEAVGWLRACLWPHDLERLRRFELAVALAQRGAWPVRQAADCIAALEVAVHELPEGIMPVVLNSWVLTYLDAAARARYVATLEALVQARHAAWLSAEAPSLKLGGTSPLPPSSAYGELGPGTVWTLCTAGAAVPNYTWLARSHPHGTWLEWLADEARASAPMTSP